MVKENCGYLKCLGIQEHTADSALEILQGAQIYTKANAVMPSHTSS